MVDLNLKSAGVGTREIDLTGPSAVVPAGIPAGIVGVAAQGPAFVPVTVANLNQFKLTFGDEDNAGKFGPIAVAEWLRNAQAATFLRVLGVGKGEKRTSSGDNAGRVESAGFVVGSEVPDADGVLGSNEYANTNGPLGRVHFLGCWMSESAGSTFFSEAGRQSDDGFPVPTIRGVIFAPSGVVPTLATSSNDIPPTPSTIATSHGPQGSVTGSVTLIEGSTAKQEFVMFLNGHKGNDASNPRVLTASFDVTSPNYFGNIFNTDPTRIQQAGHYLYARYDVHNAFAAVTGSGLLEGALGARQNIAFLTTGSQSRNSGSTTAPSFENFEDRFSTAKTPYIVSQKFGGKNKDLFRVHALHDGARINDRIKVSIENIAKSSVESNRYGTFDLLVRQFDDTDANKVVLERYPGLTLDPDSDRYIARAIGDMNLYFDFDRAVGAQRLRAEGQYPNRSNYIRVEVTSIVDDAEVDATALPIGFRGPPHLVVSGTAPLASPAGDPSVHQDIDATGSLLTRATEPPVPMRRTVSLGTGQKKVSDKNLYWGVQYELADDIDEPNKAKKPNKTLNSLVKYFPNFHTVWQAPLAEDNSGAADTAENGIIDVDRYNNNLFSLEKLKVVTGSDGVASVKSLEDWSYVRQGGIASDDSTKTRAFNVETDLASLSVRNVAKYTLYLQGGFDGTSIFDEDAAQFTDRAVKEEMDNVDRGQNDGPTVKAYNKALELMANETEVDVKLLAIPGIRHEVVTDEVINTVEDRFDAMGIIDVEERDTLNAVVTSSAEQTIGVGNTVDAFSLRGLDTNMAAAYFPNVVMVDPFSGLEAQVPPSVAALGALALNDNIARPWNAPAGVTRGALPTTTDAAVRLSRQNMNDLYEVDINPIVSFPDDGGVVVWGQKTLYKTDSALDRINVRRLLIEVRRQVREVSNNILFEPNRAATLERFSNLVTPLLQRVQDQQGVDGFKVIIDSSTTTQADVENNVIRGKIFLRPTRTAEFISLDFKLTNQGGFAGA